MLRIAVIASLALSSIALAVNPRSVDVTGSYSSNWDDVKLVQEGNRVHGTYVCCGGGTIEGRIISGRTLRYEWKGNNGTWGLGAWKADPDKLDGTWGSGQNEGNGGRWDLVRKQRSNSQLAN